MYQFDAPQLFLVRELRFVDRPLQILLVTQQLAFLFIVRVLGHFKRDQRFRLRFRQVVLVLELEVLDFLPVEFQLALVLFGRLFDLSVFVPMNGR